jgi:glycine/D-amino acid oxidase-like deaminating enzyme
MTKRSAGYDVVIVGGAIIGSAVAYFLTADESFQGRVLVIEKDPSYQDCSTTRSLASIRQQFSTPVNIQLSQFGVEFLRAVKDRLGADVEVGFREAGYLLLASETGKAILERNVRVQTQQGADVCLLGPAELQARFPWLTTSDLVAGCLGLSGEGWFDAHSLLYALRNTAAARGAEFLTGEVVGLHGSPQRLEAVQLADGRVFPCGELVNAAGPAAGKIARMADIELPVESRKRCVFVFDCRQADVLQACPLVVDVSGVYFRPEGQYFVCGVSPPEDQDPPTEDFRVEHHLFDEIVWPALAHRVPVFEAIKQVNAWSGHYAYNTLDQNAIVGRHPVLKNFLFANGFSGHGVQQAPGVGCGIAELIVHGAYQTVDITPLGFERVVAGRPLRELNVI